MIATPNPQTLSLGAAFVAGLIGSTHCFAMCGGFAGALGLRAKRIGIGHAKILLHNFAAQVGRIGSYACAGAIAAGLISSVSDALDGLLELTQISQTVRLIAGLMLIAIAIRIAFAWNLFAALERVGARFWSRLRPLTQRAAARTQFGASLLLGIAWGWLPCGLVYSLLLYAAFSGSIIQGAATMLAFGLGTLPAMLVAGEVAGHLSRLFARPAMHWVAASMLVSFGVLTIAAVFPTAHHH